MKFQENFQCRLHEFERSIENLEGEKNSTIKENLNLLSELNDLKTKLSKEKIYSKEILNDRDNLQRNLTILQSKDFYFQNCNEFQTSMSLELEEIKKQNEE